jgi:hypothetical protein
MSMRSLLFLIASAFASLCTAQSPCADLAYSVEVVRVLDSLADAELLVNLDELDIRVDRLDREHTMIIAMYAAEGGSHDLYFECVNKLIECGGLVPSDQSMDNIVLNKSIHGADSLRFKQAVDSLYPRFLASNYTRLEAIAELDRISALDQVRRILDAPISMENKSGPARSEHGSTIALIDSANFAALLALCAKYGELPLSDRYGWRSTGIVTTLLLHNGQGPRAAENWRAIWPYITEAMSNCRTGDRFLSVYDRCYYNLHRVQWFGTIPNVPVRGGDVGDRRIRMVIE